MHAHSFDGRQLRHRKIDLNGQARERTVEVTGLVDLYLLRRRDLVLLLDLVALCLRVIERADELIVVEHVALRRRQ